MATNNGLNLSLSGQSGSGAVAGTTSPVFTTPTLGVAAATSLNLGEGADLDYYNEGTWTPSITASTVGNLSVSYSTQEGTFTRVGTTVIARFNLITSSFTWTTASGTIRIAGLPFTTNGGGGVGALRLGGWTSTQSWVNVYQNDAETFLRLTECETAAAPTAASITSFPSGGSVLMSGVIVFYA